MTVVLTNLPIPPSTNNLFANNPGGGRFKSDLYRTWRSACGWEVRRQRAARVKGPVSLTYTFERHGTRADLGNLEKAMTDLLVELCIIDGDGPEIVQEITLRWGAIQGAQIRIEPAKVAVPLLERAA